MVYDDERARTVPRQTQAISEALNRANARSGRALLVLPETARPDLHHHVKTANWPDLQFQCADAARIRRFYRYRPGNGLEVPGDRRGRYSGYIGKLACALLIVNRQWAWCLNNPLHADLIVGIDVLHGRAGFTFVYDHGAQIVFKDAKSHRPEQLSRDLMRDTIIRGVRSDLRRETERRAAIRSLTVHRDGRVYDSERAGIWAAVRQLISEGLLTNDVRVTIVAIPKKTSINLRLFAGPTPGEVRNPRIGSYLVLNEREGVVATTGYPFNLPGTAIPLHASIVEGDMPIEQVLQDIFCLAQLAFSAPDLPLRTPISTKLANDFLEPIAARFDMETALYEGDKGEDAVAREPARARVAEIVSGGASA